MYQKILRSQQFLIHWVFVALGVFGGFGVLSTLGVFGTLGVLGAFGVLSAPGVLIAFGVFIVFFVLSALECIYCVERAGHIGYVVGYGGRVECAWYIGQGLLAMVGVLSGLFSARVCLF